VDTFELTQRNREKLVVSNGRRCVLESQSAGVAPQRGDPACLAQREPAPRFVDARCSHERDTCCPRHALDPCVSLIRKCIQTLAPGERGDHSEHWTGRAPFRSTIQSALRIPSSGYAQWEVPLTLHLTSDQLGTCARSV